MKIANSNAVSTTNGAGESASYTYDGNGRVTGVTESTDHCNALFFKGIAYANRFAERTFIRFAPLTLET